MKKIEKLGKEKIEKLGKEKKEKIKSAVSGRVEKLKEDNPLKTLRKGRAAEIFGVFAKHNFYAGGFSPSEMRTTLEDLGPTYVKIGQIMSGRSDLLPESYCRELSKLRSSVRPMDAQTVRGVIEEQTGKKIGEIYREFNDDPLGSASIAQAHAGVLLDGTRVVTKVQRPYIAEMMREDFVLLHKFAAVVNVAAEGEGGANMVDLQSVIAELEKVTEEELDFRVEAQNTREFREKCVGQDDRISCPEILDALSTEKILTMTFVDGYSIGKSEKIDADGVDRVAVGTVLLENYMHQVLDVGVFHGDPHEGNIMISGGKPVWIDFGMIGRISKEKIGTLQEIVLSMVQGDVEALTDAALSLGVVNGKVNKEKLNEEVDALIKRYLMVKDLRTIDIGAVMVDLTALLAEHHVSVPGEYTMLARSIVTLEGVLAGFCPELNLFEVLSREMFRRAKENFSFKSKLRSLIESLALTGRQSVRLPGMAFDALKNLVRGKAKIGFELTGYDDLLGKVLEAVKDLTLAAFACVLFAGCCILCTTDLSPQVNGIPVGALIGFIAAAALAIHAVYRMTQIGKR